MINKCLLVAKTSETLQSLPYSTQLNLKLLLHVPHISRHKTV